MNRFSKEKMQPSYSILKFTQSSARRINSLKVYEDLFDIEPDKISETSCLDEMGSHEMESTKDINAEIWKELYGSSGRLDKIESKLSFVENANNLEENSKTPKHISIKTKTTIKSLHVTILTECLQKLQILGIVGPTSSVDLKHLKSVFKTTKDLKNSPYYNNITKCNLDRLFIEDLIFAAIKDLTIYNSTNTFNKLVSKLSNESSEMLQTFNSSIMMKQRVGNLSFEVDEKKNKMKEEMEMFCNELGRLKDLYEDVLIENKLKIRYVTKWEDARQYQQKMKLKLQQDEIKRDMDRLKQAQLDENLVHEQTVLFQTAIMNDCWKQIEKWSNKCDIDFSQMNTKIRIAIRDKEFIEGRIVALQNQYTSQQKEITDYLIARETRRKEAILFKERTSAAIKIQAWWRGLMYRLGLGPYRKKKGKKNGKNGNSGKSDKKKK